MLLIKVKYNFNKTSSCTFMSLLNTPSNHSVKAEQFLYLQCCDTKLWCFLCSHTLSYTSVALRYAELFHKFLTIFLSQIFVLKKKKKAKFTNNYVLRCKVSGIKTLCVISLLCFLMFATKNKLISDWRNLGNSNVLKL